MSVGVPSDRESRIIDFPEEVARALVIDPVFAWSVFIPGKYRLDASQAVRLRYMWHVPRIMDSTAVGCGKSMLNIGFALMRMVILPDQKVGIYFPNFATGQDEFWEPMCRMIKESKLLSGQVDPTRSNKGQRKGQSEWSIWFKNESSCHLLPGNFINDSQTAAGRNFNTLVVDDWLRCEEMGDGLDKQLLDRVRRGCWNMHHPVWGNHTVLLGHAETPEHKGYRRYLAYGRKIAAGSTAHARISFCSQDMHDVELPIHEEARQRKGEMERSAWLRQHCGLWIRGGSNFYPGDLVNRCRRKGIWPRVKAVDLTGSTVGGGGASAKVIGQWRVAGEDVAKGEGERSDFTALASILVMELGGMEGATLVRKGRFFRMEFDHASVPRKPEGRKGWSGRQLAGLIYRADKVLGGFDRFILDKGGGGAWVYSDVKRPTQVIEGKPEAVTPMVRPDDGDAAGGRPVLQYFGRFTPIKELVEPHYWKSDDGILDAFHRKLLAAVERQEILFPAHPEERPRRALSALSAEEREVYGHVERALTELQNVRQLRRSRGGGEPEPLLSANGYYRFEAKGKKDCAYALLYAYVAALWLLEDLTEVDGEENELCV